MSAHPKPQPWQPEYLAHLLQPPARVDAPAPPARVLRVAPGVLEILGAETLRRLAQSVG